MHETTSKHHGWRVGLAAMLIWALSCPSILLMSQSAWAAFVEAPDAQFPKVNDTSYTFATGDVNGDGNTDVIVANAGQSRLLLGDGQGSFTDATATHLPALSLTSMTAVLGDMDGDTDADIILGDVRGPNRLLFNDGTGRFRLAPETNLPAQAQITIGMALGDVDRDGDLDLVVANRRSQNRLWLNDGSDVFIDATPSHLPAEELDSYGVALGDVDGNGTLDLVVTNHRVPDQLWLNNGQGVFRDVTARQFSGAVSDSFDVQWIDIEADGDLDVAITAGKSPLRLWLNNGQGIFADVTAARLPDLRGFGMKAEVGDVDDDGDPDLVLAAAGQDRVLLNDGNGHFSQADETWMPINRQRSFGIALLDADHDLDPDLLVATPSGPNRFLRNALPSPRLRLLATPAPYAVGRAITLTIQAADEDGLASAHLTRTDPAGQTQQMPLLSDLADGQATTTLTPALTGDYRIAVTVADAHGHVKTREMRLAVPATSSIATPPIAVTADPPAKITAEKPVKKKVSGLLTFNPF